MPKHTILVAAATALALVVAGCSSNTAGTPTPSPSSASASASASVNLAALDTGTYATSPRAPFGFVRGADLAEIESQRMAEFTTLPFEVDPTFTEPSLPYGTFVSERSTKRYFQLTPDESLAALKKSGGLLAGFYGTAGPTGDAKTSFSHGVIRFTDDAAAARAAQALHQVDLAQKSKFRPMMLPSSPGTLVSVTEAAGVQGFNAFTAYKSYLLLDGFSVPTANAASRADALVRKSLDLQRPLIDRFPQTAAKGGSVLKDQNKILIYALADPGSVNPLNDAVLGPRGLSFSYGPSDETYKQLIDAGIDHVANGMTIVARARDDAAAIRFDKEFNTPNPQTEEVVAASPRGLPTARCRVNNKSRASCSVVVGRYVASTVQGETLELMQQQISAQYKILLEADQNAS
ncbi:hypothetical protein [Williamsia sp. CHRR-6]|uniref:DUF7373 family lipoprotein n=1 Tax=Williamsia sp. CHRR-6 TaxID=2835871 RepID=UPI001BD9FEA8|nr:hypothetical protein [Williamsia sp. CHRR-6]MBT0566345.1 hypothetical protein [Williamsia sp. CHRR-6]